MDVWGFVIVEVDPDHDPEEADVGLRRRIAACEGLEPGGDGCCESWFAGRQLMKRVDARRAEPEDRVAERDPILRSGICKVGQELGQGAAGRVRAVHWVLLTETVGQVVRPWAQPSRARRADSPSSDRSQVDSQRPRCHSQNSSRLTPR